MSKKLSQRDRVRARLLEHGSITRDYAVYTMRPGINRLSERIRELKAEGLDISEGQNVPGSADTLYVLNSRPPAKPAPPKIEVVMVDGRPIARLIPSV